MTIKTILVEDEHPAIQRLARLLKKFEDRIEIIGQAMDGQEALELIEARKPDLIFLDIQMPELNGFEVLARLEHQPMVIFTTAYDQYALRAFEANTIDYLLKPIDPARLEKAITKLENFSGGNDHGLGDKVQDLLKGLGLAGAEQDRGPLRIQVRTGNKIRFLKPEEIHWFQSVDKYVEAHTAEKTWLLSETLAALEARLPAADFVRIHRSALINWSQLGEVIRESEGRYQVRMNDGDNTLLPVSRQGRARLGLS